jgi:hypothetical protein
LVPNRQNAYLILGSHESIQGDMARLTVGNDQLAQFAFYAPANQGVRGQDLDGRLDSTRWSRWAAAPSIANGGSLSCGWSVHSPRQLGK